VVAVADHPVEARDDDAVEDRVEDVAVALREEPALGEHPRVADRARGLVGHAAQQVEVGRLEHQRPAVGGDREGAVEGAAAHQVGDREAAHPVPVGVRGVFGERRDRGVLHPLGAVALGIRDAGVGEERGQRGRVVGALGVHHPV
jgi:hypothetical protein